MVNSKKFYEYARKFIERKKKICNWYQTVYRRAIPMILNESFVPSRTVSLEDAFNGSSFDFDHFIRFDRTLSPYSTIFRVVKYSSNAFIKIFMPLLNPRCWQLKTRSTDDQISIYKFRISRYLNYVIYQSYIHLVYFTIVNHVLLFLSAFHKTKIFKIDYFGFWKSYYDSDWLFTRR